MATSMPPPTPRPRLRDWGFVVGSLTPGPRNALTDVHPVRVGHTTLIRGQGPLRIGHGPVRTGVTVILPHPGNLFQEKVPAAVHTINGFGKACGFEEIRELGHLESPIALTNTLNVWRVADALVTDALHMSPEIGVRTSSVNVVVGECNDGYLNDLQGRHVDAEAVAAALEQARTMPPGAPVAEGCVGAGTGTSCFGWKGGIGTASRMLPRDQGGWTLGALVQTNFGRPEQLVFAGMAIGRDLRPPPSSGRPGPGSVMVVLATDAPLDARQLRRLCVRAQAGLARTGSLFDPGSGDFVIAFSTAQRLPHRPESLTGPATLLVDEPRAMRHLFQAVVEAVEEAVLNALCTAVTMDGRDGHVCHALPIAQIRQRYGAPPGKG